MRLAGYELQRFLRRVALCNPGISWPNAALLVAWGERCAR